MAILQKAANCFNGGDRFRHLAVVAVNTSQIAIPAIPSLENISSCQYAFNEDEEVVGIDDERLPMDLVDGQLLLLPIAQCLIGTLNGQSLALAEVVAITDQLERGLFRIVARQ